MKRCPIILAIAIGVAVLLVVSAIYGTVTGVSSGADPTEHFAPNLELSIRYR